MIVIFNYIHRYILGMMCYQLYVLDFAGSRSSLNIFAGNGCKKRFALYLG